MKVREKIKRGVLSAHIIFVVAWLGTSICTLVLLLFHQNSANQNEISTIHNIIKLFYYGILVPSAIGSIKTGVVLSLLTHWGFVKYLWILVKWVASIFMIIFLTVFIGGWINSKDSIYLSDKNMLVMGLSVQIASLVVIIIISVFKPWGKIKKTRRLAKTEA